MFLVASSFFSMARLVPVHARHVDVEHDQVDRVGEYLSTASIPSAVVLQPAPDTIFSIMRRTNGLSSAIRTRGTWRPWKTRQLMGRERILTFGLVGLRRSDNPPL
jgi:hypothetical protein